MNTLIQVDNLTKKYEDHKALDGFTCSIEKGRVYGLIGRNGAGKTTLLKLLNRILNKTAGTIVWDETLVSTDIVFARDYSIYYTGQKMKDLLYMASLIYPNYNKDIEKELVDGFNLELKKNYQKSSKGMQTMVSLIMALASDAKILLLDEPYVGLDPINREFFYKMLRKYYFNEEKTVIMSSHLINEIEGYFEECIMIDRGKVILNEEVDHIYERSIVVEGDDQVHNFLKENVKVIGYESMMKIYTTYVYDTLSEDTKKKIEELGGEIRRMDLQKLMIEMVTERGESYDIN